MKCSNGKNSGREELPNAQAQKKEKVLSVQENSVYLHRNSNDT